MVLVASVVLLGHACTSSAPGSDAPAPSQAPGTPSNAITSTAFNGPVRHSIVQYGTGPSQFGQIWTLDPMPSTDVAAPVVVLIHGGFWRAAYGLDLMEPLARALAARGYVVWNIEYRRVGQPGGGYPGTLEDVADAVDAVATLPVAVDLMRVAVVGHSAGGQLALWAGSRADLPAGAPGANPAVVPLLSIGQGPVFDLVAGDDAGLGGGAVTEFLGGGADTYPERYRVATPSAGPRAHLVVVRGSEDDIVAARFTVPTPLGGVQLVEVPGADHFDLIDPTGAAGDAVVALLGAGLSHP